MSCFGLTRLDADPELTRMPNVPAARAPSLEGTPAQTTVDCD